MDVAFWICSILLICEFVMAPINLWTGKTMHNFTHFTGLSPRVATNVFAPVKLVGAVLLIVGLFERKVAAAGAAVIGVVCLAYLIRLASPKRRDASGLGAFGFGLACCAIVFVVAFR